MKLSDASSRWDRLKSWKGKYKKFEVIIAQNQSAERYYYYLSRKEDDIRYNCLWEGKEYKSLDEASDAVTDWIDEKLKGIK